MAQPKFSKGDVVEHRHAGPCLIIEVYDRMGMYHIENRGYRCDIPFQNLEASAELKFPATQNNTENQVSQIETPVVKTQPIITLQDAMRVEMQNKKPRLTGIPAQWKSEGRCPQCGELGRFSMSVPICSRHGEY